MLTHTMNPSKEVLDNKLAEFERASNCSELEIYLELEKLRNGDIEDEPCPEWVYESMAFAFLENYTDKKNGGGTYFGPLAVWQTNDGKTVENPSLAHVNEDAIAYWEKRSQSTNNPLLKARYAGLVWDLSLTATGKRPHYSLAHRCCEAIFEIAERRSHKYDVDVIKKLKRALSIAISLNSEELIQRAKEAILKYEDLLAEDSKPGLWGFSFDLLVVNKKVNLSNREEREIIDALEARLQRLKDGEPWACEHAAERLARYYRAKGQEDDCSRVIEILGSAFENAAKNVAPVLASSWLEHIHQVYIQFNLKADADRVAQSIRELGPKMRDEMKAISHEMKIPREEFDAYVEQMADGDLDTALERITSHYIPPREEVENQLHDLAQQAPISFLFSRQITDYQGRMVAVVGPLEDDLDGNIVRQMSQNMTLSFMFLSAVLDKAISKFSLTDEVILSYLFQAPIFTPQQKELLSIGIRAYLGKEYVVAVHLLIPQIEAAIRNLVEMSGGAVLKPRQGGGFHLRTLDDILRSEQVKHALGEDVALYFRVVLTDQRGWNIRNDVCHGSSPHDQLSKGVADRLMHILLVLAQLRVEET
jgi:hypothetical protein